MYAVVATRVTPGKMGLRSWKLQGIPLPPGHVADCRVDFVYGYHMYVQWDGWMNQAYSRLSTTHGHITDCKLLVCMSKSICSVGKLLKPVAHHKQYNTQNVPIFAHMTFC